jgi:ankyrin repeat protein
MFASARGRLDCVKILLAAGADVTAKTHFGRTALMIAEIGAKDNVVAVLKAVGVKE